MRNFPVATYRLQLRQDFGFDQAAALVPYLSELGISHVYLSPVFRAAPGSTHGYDVTDPNRVDETIGGEPARQRFLGAVAAAGLKHIVDVVPNHMSVATDENLWWWDLLEKGPSSEHASSFDVEWEGPTDEAKSKVLLPILTEHYGRALEARQIQVVREPGGLVLSAMGRRLPLALESLAALYLATARAVSSEKLEFLAGALAVTQAEKELDRRRRNLRVIRAEIAALLEQDATLAEELDRRVAHLNSDYQALDDLVTRQYYRLAHYRIARYDLDYRRFFDIHDLAALSVHDPSVFQRTHALVLEWIARGEVDGVRIDHPDGLRDPTGYFERLAKGRKDLWVVAEKILEPGEKLPEDWDVSGTTGYDFLNEVGGLFVDRDAEGRMTELYREFLGVAEAPDFKAEELASKRFVLDDLLGAELRRLTRLFQRVCASKRRHRDFATEELRRALREVIAAFPVYRTYLQPNSPHRAADVGYVRDAMHLVRASSAELDTELLDFLEELLSGNCLSELEWEFVLRFQQLSSAAMAKGLEDTAFYRYFRLVALNEVGGSPARFGVTLDEFHAFAARLQARWPETLVTVTTHDTKRSQDARLRVAALSELGEEWATAVHSWSALARAHKTGPLPDPAIEYLIWQTLVAAFPIPEQRLTTYLEKAMREAKQQTSWLAPNPEYENAVMRFARRVLADERISAEIAQFVEQVQEIAWRSSLSETLVQLTACGVPDIYQGGERWDTRLTDPDNRGLVDFDALRRLLEKTKNANAEGALSGLREGAPKMWLIQRALRVRKEHPEWFGPAARYRAIRARGAHADRVVSFQRSDRVVVVAPRLWAGIVKHGFADTRIGLPSYSFRNVLDGDTRYQGTVELGSLLSAFPVALLVAENES